MKSRAKKSLRARHVIACGAVALLVGCGGGRDLEAEFDALIEAGDWDEVLAHVEVVKAEGSTDPFLDFAEGYALLQQGADAAADEPLERAITSRPDLAERVGQVYERLAWKDQESDWDQRAKRRMARAIRFDPSIDPGALLDPAADYFFRFADDYERALPLYARLYEELPEPVSKHPEWVYRYGYCLQAAGSEDAALGVYDDFVRRFPDEKAFTRFVRWWQISIWLERAEARLSTSDPDAAMAYVQQCIDAKWHLDLQQKARVLAGRIEEARGDLQAAREWYAAVVEKGNEHGGEVVREASARLEELGEMGVH